MDLKNWRVMLSCAAVVAFSAPAWSACVSGTEGQKTLDDYTLNGGEATDKKTGLTWQRCSLGQTWKGNACEGEIRGMTWGEAMKQGSGDWRVPTLKELETIVSPGCKKPAVNDTVFPNMRVERMLYWTSTPNNKSTSWTVDFFDGVSGPYNSISTPTPGAVRLVRGGAQ
jgi:hypothetical protein